MADMSRLKNGEIPFRSAIWKHKVPLLHMYVGQ